MKFGRAVALFALLLPLQACGTYSTSSMTEAPNAPQISARPHKAPEQIQISQSDILDRPYTSLGDISVTVRKVSLFDSDPTQELVNKALQEKASDIGADAVVLVRYGSVGIGVMSWGQMDGDGRAIIFQ